MPKTTKTIPVPGRLGRLLQAQGLRAELLVTTAEGEPLSPTERRSLAATLEALESLEAREASALAAVAALAPAASSLPSSEIMAAVAAGGGLREDGPVTSKPASKPASKRPSK